jgi:hypothetical protein
MHWKGTSSNFSNVYGDMTAVHCLNFEPYAIALVQIVSVANEAINIKI